MNLKLSQNPNTKNILKISSIYNSFAFPNMRNKIKINLNQNANVINEENNKEDEKESVSNKIEVNEEMKKIILVKVILKVQDIKNYLMIQ